MKISTKGRYALRMMLDVAQHQDEGYVTLKDIASRQAISKKYLEQIALQLTQAGMLRAVRGHQGGYRLTREPDQINAHEILTALEQILFENTETSVEEASPAIEHTMQKCVFTPLDRAVQEHLEKITLDELVAEAGRYKGNNHFMFFI